MNLSFSRPRRSSMTRAGGSRLKSLARSQREMREIPAHGPHFMFRSKALSSFSSASVSGGSGSSSEAAGPATDEASGAAAAGVAGESTGSSSSSSSAAGSSCSGSAAVAASFDRSAEGGAVRAFRKRAPSVPGEPSARVILEAFEPLLDDPGDARLRGDAFVLMCARSRGSGEPRKSAREDDVSHEGRFCVLAAVATMGCAASTSNAAPSGDKPPGKVDRKGLCKKVFQAMDSDGDGYVDINEFMATQKGGDDPMEATMLFHMLDSQKKSDGKLELDEFIKGMALLGSDDATFKKEMEDVLAHLAAKKNAPPPAKSISGGEVTSAPEHERAIAIAAAPIVETPVSAIDPRVTEVFNLIDKNQDGRLSKAELLIALRKNESVRAALGMDNVSDGEGKEKFEAAFQKMDTDGSASISMSELNSYLAGALP